MLFCMCCFWYAYLKTLPVRKNFPTPQKKNKICALTAKNRHSNSYENLSFQ